jgi:hypothetical protein
VSQSNIKTYSALKREARKRKWVKRLHFINDRGQALCKPWSFEMSRIVWMMVSGYLIYRTNFFRELWENPHRVMFFFDLSMMGLGINMALLLYMTIYLPYVKRIPVDQLDYERDCPKLIPVLTIVGFVAFFRYAHIINFCSFILALWPVWGFLTPILMFILFMGASMTMVFLPSGILGSIIFWGAVVFLATASHLIPHQDVDAGHVHT